MNIAIIGCGLTGSLSAISLAKAGCIVDLYERLSDEELINRDRTYAITHSSRKILSKLHIWNKLVNKFIPFQYLNLIDYEINKMVVFSLNDLNHTNRKYSSIGWIAKHEKLMSTILNEIANNNYINRIPTSVIPNPNNYDLILVADGSNSATKRKLKIRSFGFEYDQVCIAAKVLLRGVKSNEAFEILHSDGPFAALPLGGDLFQIICSQSIAKASHNLNLSKSLFLDYLATILPNGVQLDTLVDIPQSFRIKFLFNYLLYSGKYIFLGETAHVIHPVGGQGLNLCWRDVDSLTKIISNPLLNKYKLFIPIFYSFYRVIDIITVAILTDSLVRYSRCKVTIFKAFRSMLFLILRKSSIIKKSILSLMTNGV